MRREGTETVRMLLESPEVKVIPQNRALFLEGLALYERRLDKQYSLTDCLSMHIMRREGLTEILTNDHHFAQEGSRSCFRHKAECQRSSCLAARDKIFCVSSAG